MALNINIPNSSYSEQLVSLDNVLVSLTLKYIKDSWYIDLKNSTKTINIISGVKVMPNQNLTGRSILDVLPEGNLWCLRVGGTDSAKPTRNDFGIGKDYSLYWISAQEEQELGLDGKIQL